MSVLMQFVQELLKSNFPKLGASMNQLEIAKEKILSIISIKRFGNYEEAVDGIVARLKATYVSRSNWEVSGKINVWLLN
jgi:hypothetical protein